MARRRFLPKYVSEFLDRHRKPHLRFRRKGWPADGKYFKSVLGTEAFRAEYHAFMNPEENREPPSVERAKVGSIGELFARYCSPVERLGPTKVTQGKVRAVLERFVEGRHEWPASMAKFDDLDEIIASARSKATIETDYGPRIIGGVDAAKKLRKELIRMFEFGVKLGMLPNNQAALTSPVKVAVGERSKGYHPWTEDEIQMFRDRHALGTRERLALEMLLWSGQRRGDVRLFGRTNIVNGRIVMTAGKTGKDASIPVAPQLARAIMAMPSNGTLFFLVTHKALPFTAAGFGNWFRDACDEAGLPHCTAHGLRKAIMRRMANLQISNQGMKAISLHSKDDEVALYTRDANQSMLADHAIATVSQWEMSNLEHGLDTRDAV